MKNWSGFQHIHYVAQVKEQSLAMILNFLVIIADGQRQNKKKKNETDLCCNYKP